jgi:hypothetical protein
MSGRRDGASGQRNDVSVGFRYRKDRRESRGLGAAEDLAADAGSAGRFIVGIMELDALCLDMRIGVAAAYFEQWRQADRYLRDGNQ